MPLKPCVDCGEPVGSSAAVCPKCGAKVPHTRWWLWIPIGGMAVFAMYALTIPEYELRASDLRSACLEIAGHWPHNDCQARYSRQVASARANGGVVRGNEAPIDNALNQRTSAARVKDDAADLKVCKVNLGKKRAEYQALMGGGEYWSAALALSRCAELLADPDLKKLVADAEIRQYVADIEGIGSSKEKRSESAKALLRYYPEVGQRYASFAKR